MGATIVVLIAFLIKVLLVLMTVISLIFFVRGIAYVFKKGKSADNTPSRLVIRKICGFLLCLPFMSILIGVVAYHNLKRIEFHNEIGPFLTAIHTNNIEAINEYLNNGYLEDSTVTEKYYPLTFAVMHNKNYVIKLLIDNGYNPNDSTDGYPLIYSVMKDNVELTKFLLESGADPELPSMCLYIRALYSEASFEMFQTLFNLGVPFDEMDGYRESPLYNIVKEYQKYPTEREKQIITLFLQNQANIYLENSYGESVCDLAHSVGSTPDFIEFFDNEIKKYYTE